MYCICLGWNCCPIRQLSTDFSFHSLCWKFHTIDWPILTVSAQHFLCSTKFCRLIIFHWCVSFVMRSVFVVSTIFNFYAAVFFCPMINFCAFTALCICRAWPTDALWVACSTSHANGTQIAPSDGRWTIRRDSSTSSLGKKSQLRQWPLKGSFGLFILALQ